MSLREQIGSLFMAGFDGYEPPPIIVDLVQNYSIGGVILFKRNIASRKQLKGLVSKLQRLSRKPLLIGIDCEGGWVRRLTKPDFKEWPPMADVKDPKVAYNIGQEMAEELRSVGINLNFAPVLDVNTDVKNPVIGDRSFSSDHEQVARLGCQMIRGLEDGGVIACGKHFPGHGDTWNDSHKTLPHLPHTIGRLRSVELVPFKAAIQDGVSAIMTAHVVYDGVDPNWPATLSPRIIRELLRTELDFKGVVVADDLCMDAISTRWGLSDAAKQAIIAGVDMLLVCHAPQDVPAIIDKLLGEVEAGHIPENRIEESANRITELAR